MKIDQIARECRLAHEIHPNKDLDNLIQRELQNRVQEEMLPYLLNQSQRFYGALFVAVYEELRSFRQLELLTSPPPEGGGF